MGRLDGKVAFITGAGKGIGSAGAVLFAREGAKVVIADIDVQAGKATEARAQEAGGEALFIDTDITDHDSVEGALAATAERFGKLDVFYNNAGGSTIHDGAVTEASDEEFWRVIKLDLYGTFVASKHGIPMIIEAGGGSVINTSSNLALMGLPGRHCYTAAKGAVASLTRAMATEYAEHNIRVNAIAPAATRTERVVNLAQANEHLDRMVKESQLFGWVQPIDVAYMAVYLASDESARTTGQVIPVDSGATIF